MISYEKTAEILARTFLIEKIVVKEGRVTFINISKTH